jgi:hypothetical protein
MHRPPRFSLWILTLLLLAGVPPAAWAAAGNAPRLQNQYQALREFARRGPFRVPLSVQSEVHDDQVSAEVSGIIEHPFEEVKAALSSPAFWCDFTPLHPNVKGCTFQRQARETLLTFYVGRRVYESPEDAAPQAYTFAVDPGEPGYLSVALSAPHGIFGTTAHRFQLEAAGAENWTVVTLRTSYVSSVTTRVLTAVYLATTGRHKVGFSREDGGADGRPQYVKGLRGVIERNAMRYYLAFEAYLDLQTIPIPQRFEAGITAVYDAMEQYPTQLHEMERAEYRDAKRRERVNQLRLQQNLTAADPHPPVR